MSVTNRQTAASLLWVAIEKFSYSILNFFSILILARLLTPFEFGLVGTLAIFISISTMLIESGFGVALVKKKEVTDIDYSTVFIFNFVISGLLFLIIFFSAGFISNYYNEPILKNVIRVLSLLFFFNAFTLTQRVHLIRELKFKLQASISLTALSISIMFAIFLAYFNFGVWALVAQRLIYAGSYSIFVFFKVRFYPKFVFSFHAFMELLSFGGRIIMSSLIQTVYNDIFALIISKIYSIKTTGLYTQSNKLVGFPLYIFKSIYDSAVFPILAKIEDKSEFKNMVSKINRAVFILSFPLLLVLPFKSRLIIEVALGHEWLDAAPILAILSIGVLISIIEMANLNALKSFGDARLFLKIGVIRTVIGLSILMITINFSLSWLLIGVVIANFISCLISIYFTNKIVHYSYLQQFKDISLPLLMALFTLSLTVYLSKFWQINIYLDLITFIFLSTSLYLGLSYVFRSKELFFVQGLIVKYIKRA